MPDGLGTNLLNAHRRIVIACRGPCPLVVVVARRIGVDGAELPTDLNQLGERGDHPTAEGHLPVAVGTLNRFLPLHLMGGLGQPQPTSGNLTEQITPGACWAIRWTVRSLRRPPPWRPWFGCEVFRLTPRTCAATWPGTPRRCSQRSSRGRDDNPAASLPRPPRCPAGAPGGGCSPRGRRRRRRGAAASWRPRCVRALRRPS